MVTRIDSTSIRDQVLVQLREMILSNGFPPGHRLSEKKLGADFGVSRTPIREALHILEREGLLEAIPRVGYTVRIPSIEEFQEIMDIRIELESLSAVWASQKQDASVIKELERNIAQLEKTIKEKEYNEFMPLNDEFHDIIDKASGRKRIFELNKGHREMMYFHKIYNIMTRSHAQRGLKEHKEIVRAIKSGNENQVRLSIHVHLDNLREHAIKQIFTKE